MKYLFMIYLLLTIASLISCSSSAGKENSFNVSCDQLSKANHVDINMEVSEGDLLVLNLCSNPTTGFQWSEVPEISDQNVLKQTYHTFTAPETGKVGSSGSEEWGMQILKQGNSTLIWEYSRPWEGGEKAVWSVTATVTVE